MKKKTVQVWGLFYRVRVNSRDKWDNDWTGPVGPFAFRDFLPDKLLTWFSGRSFFFRTRKQALDVAKEKATNANKTWTWVQYRVRPVKLTYEVL
jgi:hypothetical protein